MTVRTVLELGDPRLRTPCAALGEDAFGSPALMELVQDLIDTMRARHGAGIAAPQIGVAQQVCVLEVGDNPRYPYKPHIPLTVLVNPELTPIGDATLSLMEGCLSVPNLRGRVTRHARVRVLARTPEGDELELHAEGLTAGTLQHELDHLNGQLFVDRITDPTSLTTWSNYDDFWAKGFTDEAHSINNQYPEPLRVQHRIRSSR